MRIVEAQYIMLPIIDRLWVDHLYVMDHLKTGIGLRGYGQKDPRVEYEKEAYEIFEDLKNNIADEAIKSMFRVQIEQQPQPDALSGNGASPFELNGASEAPHALAPGGAAPAPQFEQIPAGAMTPQPARLDTQFAEKLLGPAPSSAIREVHTNRDDGEPRKPTKAGDKVGRNDVCPCGSGKKYKRCHGLTA